jgi:hypothetical protein
LIEPPEGWLAVAGGGDFDRDGLADVAVIDFIADTLTVTFGDVTAGFARSTTATDEDRERSWR